MRAVLHSFGLGAGALGLGYLLTTAVSSTASDVTGLTAATMLLVTSFLILPYKRSKAKEEFRRRIEEMRRPTEGIARPRIHHRDRPHAAQHHQRRSNRTNASTPQNPEKIEGSPKKLGKIEKEAREISGQI